jgi:hypothetical protein
LAGCSPDPVGISLPNNNVTFDPGGIAGGPGDGNLPIPHARILKLTTTGEDDTVVADETTDPPASTDWPSIGGRDVAGETRKVERWQFVIEWKRDGPKTDEEIEAALTDVYKEWRKWKQQFDPLPYFFAGNYPYNGPNTDYSAGATRMGTRDTPKKINQSDTLTINFARYWPPASVTGPLGLTKHLSYASWETYKAVSLPPRVAAYNRVKADIEALNAAIEESPFYAVTITVDGQTFAALDRVNIDLKRVIKEGLDVVAPANRTTNLPFKWDDEVVIIDESYSGRLYEAYFGYVPPKGGYSSGKLTYPAN